MPVTINGVSANVLELTEEVTDRGLVANVTYQVDWSSRHDFILGLAGDVQHSGSQTSGEITRVVPHKYPGTTGAIQSDLYALDNTIKITPVGQIMDDGAGWVTFGKVGPGNGKAKISVQYGFLSYDPNDENLYVENLRGSGQFLSLPGVPLKFVSDNKPINQDFNLLMPQVDINRSFQKLPYVDERIFDLMGRVNNAIFRGRAIGTVLLAQVETSDEKTALGRQTFGMNLSFLWRIQPWNYSFRSDTGVWDEVSNLAGARNYLSGDFSILE